jgi:hypothetical protein
VGLLFLFVLFDDSILFQLHVLRALLKETDKADKLKAHLGFITILSRVSITFAVIIIGKPEL